MDTIPFERDDAGPASSFSRDAATPKTDEQLADVVAELQRTALTPAQYAYLLQRKEQDEHATWLMQYVRKNAPWVLTVLGAIASGAYFLLTHTLTIGNKP
jgi:uncharacterized protein (DUF2126 family)